MIQSFHAGMMSPKAFETRLQKLFELRSSSFWRPCREVPMPLRALPIYSCKANILRIFQNWCFLQWLVHYKNRNIIFWKDKKKHFHFALSTTEALGSLWLSETLQPLGSPTVMRRACRLLKLLPASAKTSWSQSGNDRNKRRVKIRKLFETSNMDEFVAWKKTEESRIHFVHNSMACAAPDFVFEKWLRDANVVECIYSDIFGTKTPLWGRKRIFVESWVFCSSCVYLADGFSVNFHTRTTQAWNLIIDRLQAIAKHRPMVRAFGQIPPRCAQL